MTEAAMTIWSINARRTKLKVTITELCARAEISVRTYQRLLAGVHGRPYAATMTRLNTALNRIASGEDQENGTMAMRACYRDSMREAATKLGVDPIVALRSDPQRRATADAAWLEAAHVRRLACWIMNYCHGFRTAEIGRIAGISKQAVSQGIIKQMDDPDPKMQSILKQLEEIFA